MNLGQGEKHCEPKEIETITRWPCLIDRERRRAALFLNSEWQGAETLPHSEAATTPDP